MLIRNRLLILILSVLIPSFAAAGLAVWFVYQEQQQAQSRIATEAARTLALLVDKELLAVESVLKTLALSPALLSGDLGTFHRYARTITPPEHAVVVLSDLAGAQLLNTRLPLGSPLPPVGRAVDALREAAGPDASVVSNLFMSPLGRRHEIAVQVPVKVAGEIRYYLGMGIPASRLQVLFDQRSLPPGWIGAVADRAGIVVARSLEAEKFVGASARDRLLARIAAGEQSGVHYGVTLDGVPTAGFFSRAPFTGWTVVLNIPQSELRRPALYAATFLSVILLLLLATALFVATWYGRKTAKPIEALRLAAERLGRGEPVSLAPSGLVETDAAANAMEAAAAEIARGRTDLERRVAEAVIASEKAQRAMLQSQKLEALGRLTGGIAHDFNNILQTLSTSHQLLRLTSDPNRAESLLATCERAIDRATTLIAQMRAFGRAQETRMETFDPARAVHDALPLLRSGLPAGVTLVFDSNEAVWPVRADRVQFELSLLNLIINARDAIVSTGTVHIALCNVVLTGSVPSPRLVEGDYICITVTDDGCGMSSEVLGQALDPFYTTKSVDKGSGLGLPQAYGFAQQCGGTLTLDSAEGQGTTVSIYLPRAHCEINSNAEPQRSSNSQCTTGNGVLLFVEDDSLVREAVVPALHAAGFKVVVAENGERAMHIIESGTHIDHLFSDIVMPGSISGVDLARFMRARRPDVPVLLATGYSDTPVDLAGVRLLAKPYRIEDALSALANG